ncbi:hypothetical protein BH11MYX2_BH11MYX2_00650 [soil metagenome]
MWRVASSIPLNGLILFFVVFAIFAVLGAFKLRADHAPDRTMGVRPIAIALAAAALCSFITCFALNYSSLQPRPEARREYNVIDLDTNTSQRRMLTDKELHEQTTTFGEALADKARREEAKQRAGSDEAQRAVGDAHR